MCNNNDNTIIKMSEEGTAYTNIKPYNKKRPVIKAAEKKEIFENCRYDLDLPALRLLYALIQNLDQTNDLFPEWEIEIKLLFKYLYLENDTAKYTKVREAFQKLNENPLQWKITEKRWGIIPWFTKVTFDENDSTKVKVILNSETKPYLISFKKFAKFKTGYYMKLYRRYSTWLYPYFKSREFRRGFTVSIETLKQWTFTENNLSYNPQKNKNANVDFLRWVIGITRDKENDKWNYTMIKYKLKNGKTVEKFNGTLYEINKNTDIEVTAQVEKKGRNYDKIFFFIKTKEEAVKEKNNRKKELEFQISQTLFSGKNSNNKIHMSKVLKFASASNITAAELAKKSGYERKGEWYFKKSN